MDGRPEGILVCKYLQVSDWKYFSTIIDNDDNPLTPVNSSSYGQCRLHRIEEGASTSQEIYRVPRQYEYMSRHLYLWQREVLEGPV